MEYLANKPFLVTLILTIIFIAIFDLVFKVDNSFVRSGLSAGLAVILSPRKKKVKTQAGEKTIITWIFLKKPITLY